MCDIGTEEVVIVASFLIPIACFILIIIYKLMNSPDYIYTDEPRFPRFPRIPKKKKEKKETKIATRPIIRYGV